MTELLQRCFQRRLALRCLRQFGLVSALLSGLAIVASPAVAAAQDRYHSPPRDVHPLMLGQQQFELPSLLVADDGSRITESADWWRKKRPELIEHWTQILGKLAPTEQDAVWFGNVNEAVEVSRTQCDGYVRLELKIPLERDFLQSHLLLIPDGAKPGSCPAVIAWTSTSPDFQEPEKWWGEWLARQGYVVLTSWAFIRHYREESSYKNGAQERVYERFGHWLPMAKMVHDVQREVEYLGHISAVDPERIGFMGFSLSAKSALYVAAFAPEIKATVSIDPHLALYGDTNYGDPWYLDWRRKFPEIETPAYPDPALRGTVWSLLDSDPQRPGFERNHHELLALAAPRAVMVIGCSTDKATATHSDDAQSEAYVRRAQEVFRLLGMPQRLQYVPLTCGHQAANAEINAAWQPFFDRWLKD